MDETKTYKVLETITLNDEEKLPGTELELTVEQADEFGDKVEEVVADE